MKALKSITLSLICILCFSTIQAQTLETKIDQLLEEKFKPNESGATVLIAKKGEIVYRKAFGMANLELNVPMKPESVFQIGSMTKQFTAISILILLEQGKLNLKDEITKYIPDYPTHEKTIAIHHLLTHTSGIKSYTSIREIQDIARKDLTPTGLINFFKDKSIDFNPGEKFKYNNSGYILLGYIIEKVSGKSYADFIEETIFSKLNMDTSLYGSHTKLVKNRAYGYRGKENYTNTIYISLNIPYAAGSIMSTIDDLLKWQNAIRDNTLVSQQTIKKVFTNYSLNNGDLINYGYGWHIKERNTVKTYEHGGSIFGFKSMGVYVPSEDIYVIILTNCDCNSPTKITRKIADLVIENE